MELQSLQELDGLTEITFRKCKCYIHKEHRFTLPIVRFAQDKGYLPKPCTLILFDAHHDALEPRNMEEIAHIRANGVGLDEFIEFCGQKLSHKDDDWVKAGVELGMFDDVVIFGADLNSHPRYLREGNNVQDHTGKTHRIEIRSKFLGDSLAYQGDLSDRARQEELADLWDILGWQLVPQQGFGFKENERQILLDIDLDYFVIQWSDFLFPWPDEVFEKKFCEPSDYWSTQGWTGKMFFDGLVNKAGLITIAQEPNACGGDEKVDEIFSKVNRYFFDNQFER